MSFVTPKPAAAFSAFAIDEIESKCSTSAAQPLPDEFAARLADDVADEEDLHAGRSVPVMEMR